MPLKDDFWELFASMDHMVSKWKWKWSLIKRESQTFSLSPHDNEPWDPTGLGRLALSLSVPRLAFVAYEATAWRLHPPRLVPSLCLLAISEDGDSSQERWVWGRRAPWAQAPAQTLIYMMLTDVILLQSLSLSFTDPDILSVLSVKPRRGGRCPAMAGLHACRMIQPSCYYQHMLCNV